MCAQDKIYFLDGTIKTGKITEINDEGITIEDETTTTFPKRLVLLLEFKNGDGEVISKPTESLIYNPESITAKTKSKIDPSLFNIISVNTLALCNSDVSVFYERILPGKTIGLGFMGAYNFNQYVTNQNFFIGVLSNAKKNYDMGLFANLYSDEITEGTTVHFGILLKYLNFTFTKAIEEKVNSGGNISTNIRYAPAQGYQLATIFTGGTSTQITKKCFLKTIAGIGGFNMRGDFKQQYNYFLNKAAQSNSSNSATAFNSKFLLKLYFGINVGYNF